MTTTHYNHITMHAYRHGDLALVEVSTIEDGLEKSSDGILFSAGSGGHTHSFNGGEFYPKIEGDFIIGYLKAQNTKLYHPEHGEKEVDGLKECSIEDGIYQVRKQCEFLPDGLRPVID